MWYCYIDVSVYVHSYICRTLADVRYIYIKDLVCAKYNETISIKKGCPAFAYVIIMKLCSKCGEASLRFLFSLSRPKIYHKMHEKLLMLLDRQNQC